MYAYMITLECDPRCIDCTGSSNFDCIDCQPNIYKHSELSSPCICVGGCAEVGKYFIVGEFTCLESCPTIGYYQPMDGINYQCQECNLNCITCIGLTERDCLSCVDTAYPLDDITTTHTCTTKCGDYTAFLYELKCLSQCPNKYYGNTTTWTCERMLIQQPAQTNAYYALGVLI